MIDIFPESLSVALQEKTPVLWSPPSGYKLSFLPRHSPVATLPTLCIDVRCEPEPKNKLLVLHANGVIHNVLLFLLSNVHLVDYDLRLAYTLSIGIGYATFGFVTATRLGVERSALAQASLESVGHLVTKKKQSYNRYLMFI